MYFRLLLLTLQDKKRFFSLGTSIRISCEDIPKNSRLIRIFSLFLGSFSFFSGLAFLIIFCIIRWRCRWISRACRRVARCPSGRCSWARGPGRWWICRACRRILWGSRGIRRWSRTVSRACRWILWGTWGILRWCGGILRWGWGILRACRGIARGSGTVFGWTGGIFRACRGVPRADLET